GALANRETSLASGAKPGRPLGRPSPGETGSRPAMPRPRTGTGALHGRCTAWCVHSQHVREGIGGRRNEGIPYDSPWWSRRLIRSAAWRCCFWFWVTGSNHPDAGIRRRGTLGPSRSRNAQVVEVEGDGPTTL